MRWRSILLIVVPVVLIAGAIAYTKLESSGARKDLIPPEEIAWTVENQQVQIRSKRVVTGEIESFDIEIQLKGAAPYRITFEIDHDMFGGGFVGGLDADEDGEIELVLATRRGANASRLVEPESESGRIVEYSLEELPDDVWRRVKARLDRVTAPPYAMLAVTVGLMWLVVGLLSYLLISVRALFRRLTARTRV